MTNTVVSAEDMTKQLETLLDILKKSPNPDMAPYAAQLEEFLKKREKAAKDIRKVEVAAEMHTVSTAA